MDKHDTAPLPDFARSLKERKRIGDLRMPGEEGRFLAFVMSHDKDDHGAFSPCRSSGVRIRMVSWFSINNKIVMEVRRRVLWGDAAVSLLTHS